MNLLVDKQRQDFSSVTSRSGGVYSMQVTWGTQGKKRCQEVEKDGLKILQVRLIVK